MKLSRRSFLAGSAAAVAASQVPFHLLFPAHARADWAADLGPMVNDPMGVLALAQGFSYRVIHRVGDMMSDGYRVPGAHDAMGCFPGPAGSNTIILAVNHEQTSTSAASPYSAGQSPPPEAYDGGAGNRSRGGVSRVVLDATTLAVRSSNLLLIGTVRNCAGGVTPWGWITCEETTNSGHGYSFLCDVNASRIQAPNRLSGLGRFSHEAACVDPRTNIIYETEDTSGDGCFYRHVPTDMSMPFVGRLQAMRIPGMNGVDTAPFATVGQTWSVDWVDVPDPSGLTASQGISRGAARVSRGEGIWFGNGKVYFVSTDGGRGSLGQIFEHDPVAQTLRLLASPGMSAQMGNPDNIVVTPWGDLMFCEDGADPNFVRVLTVDGRYRDFARLTTGEVAGACFSPDGRTMFLNLQRQGLTVAITGPFPATLSPVADAGVGPRDAGSVSSDMGSAIADAGPQQPPDMGVLLDAGGNLPGADAGPIAFVDGGSVGSADSGPLGGTDSGPFGGSDSGGAMAGRDATTGALDAGGGEIAKGGCGCDVPGAGSSGTGALASAAIVGAAVLYRAVTKNSDSDEG